MALYKSVLLSVSVRVAVLACITVAHDKPPSWTLAGFLSERGHQKRGSSSALGAVAPQHAKQMSCWPCCRGASFTFARAVWGHGTGWSKSSITLWAMQLLEVVCKHRSMQICWSLRCDPRPRSLLTRDVSRPHRFFQEILIFKKLKAGFRCLNTDIELHNRTSWDGPMVLGGTVGNWREMWILQEWQLEAKGDVSWHLRWH